MVLSNCVSPIIHKEPSLAISGSLPVGAAKLNDTEPELSLEIGITSGAAGSAQTTEDGCAVQCAVHGPRATQRSGVTDMDMMQFECEVRFAQFSSCPHYSTTLQSLLGSSQIAPSATSVLSKAAVEVLLADALREALVGVICAEQAPKTTLSLFVTILKSSGNIGHDLAMAITCSSLALADASVEMIDLVTASTVALSSDSAAAQTISHVSGCDAMRATSYVTVASRRNAPEMTQLWSEGRVRSDALLAMVERACRMNAKKCDKIGETIVGKLKNVGRV
jgi:exosome complex component MTR3